jgi:hypothetical protein
VARACSTDRDTRNGQKLSAVNPEVKKDNLEGKGEDNIKTDLKETGWEGVE